jgi:hypothetical protein
VGDGQLAERVAANSKDRRIQVVANCVSLDWCATELPRCYYKGQIVGFVSSLIGRTADAGSSTFVHGVTAGKETHGQYLSECQVMTEGNFLQSQEGNRAQKRVWREMSDKIESLSPVAITVVN